MFITDEDLNRYRAQTYRIGASLRLQKTADARHFVEQRGFVTLWPIKDIELPSLWVATAGDRPVASAHDDPGHITWRWKDQMLDQRVWFYGKLLRGKATFISLDFLPAFYALSTRVADLDDFKDAYRDGQITREAHSIASALLQYGPLDTVELRRKSHLSSRGSKSRFDKALSDLQRGMWVVPCGTAEAGSWRYSFVYELFDRWHTEAVLQAREISIQFAQDEILNCYLRSIGAISTQMIQRLLRWKMSVIESTLSRLEGTERAIVLDDGRWCTTALFSNRTR